MCGNVGSKKPFEQDCTRVQHPKTLLAQWLRDVHFVIKVIIWPFLIFSLTLDGLLCSQLAPRQSSLGIIA